MVKLKVARLLKARQMTPYRLAKEAGISLATAYRLADPTGDFDRLEARTIDALCRVFDCSPGELFTYRKGTP